jgi:RNA polymerase sigma factor (sigma-70 family)
MHNPFAQSAASDPEDRELVRQAQGGNREALEQLITRHQAWIFNIVLRMVYLPQDAEDATQEILVKLITKLSTFVGNSSFRTWLYRIVVNHVLNMKRGRADMAGWSFTRYSDSLEATPDLDLPESPCAGSRAAARRTTFSQTRSSLSSAVPSIGGARAIRRDSSRSWRRIRRISIR